MSDQPSNFKIINSPQHKPLSLAFRLFISHILVMLVAISFLVIVGKYSSPILFLRHIEKIEAEGFDFQHVRNEVVESFDNAWHNSILLSVFVGATTAGALSLWVARRISQPIVRIEEVTQQFARGQLSARLPKNNIPQGKSILR